MIRFLNGIQSSTTKPLNVNSCKPEIVVNQCSKNL